MDYLANARDLLGIVREETDPQAALVAVDTAMVFVLLDIAESLQDIADERDEDHAE